MVKRLVYRLLLGGYYLFVAKLPGREICSFCNRFRVAYLSRLLGVIQPDKRSVVGPNVYISSGADKVQIGRFCEINERVFIQNADIGDFVMIAADVAILGASHNFRDRGMPMIEQGATWGLKVVFEDDVWVGRRAIILPGLRLGRGCVVAAGAVVTRNVPPYEIHAGVPAKKIGRRE